MYIFFYPHNFKTWGGKKYKYKNPLDKKEQKDYNKHGGKMYKLKLFLWIMVILCILFPVISNGYTIYDINVPEEVQKYLYDKCLEYDIEYELALAVIKLETEWTFDPKFKTNNTNSKEEIISVDEGLFQINSKLTDWYAELAGIKDKYNVLNPYDNILMGLAGLDFWRRYAIEKENLIDKDEIIVYMLECYTHGYNGYKEHKKFQTEYSKVVLQHYKDFKEVVTYVKEGGTVSGFAR